jgi:hypothetical protein
MSAAAAVWVMLSRTPDLPPNTGVPGLVFTEQVQCEHRANELNSTIPGITWLYFCTRVQLYDALPPERK